MSDKDVFKRMSDLELVIFCEGSMSPATREAGARIRALVEKNQRLQLERLGVIQEGYSNATRTRPSSE